MAVQIRTSTHVTFWRVVEAILPAEGPESVDDSPETVVRTSGSGTLDCIVMQASTKSE